MHIITNNHHQHPRGRSRRKSWSNVARGQSENQMRTKPPTKRRLDVEHTNVQERHHVDQSSPVHSRVGSDSMGSSWGIRGLVDPWLSLGGRLRLVSRLGIPGVPDWCLRVLGEGRWSGLNHRQSRVIVRDRIAGGWRCRTGRARGGPHEGGHGGDRESEVNIAGKSPLDWGKQAVIQWSREGQELSRGSLMASRGYRPGLHPRGRRRHRLGQRWHHPRGHAGG